MLYVHATDTSRICFNIGTNNGSKSRLDLKVNRKLGTLGVHVSTARCLMENSDLIARTSYGKNNGENTIASIERFTHVYKYNK